MPDLSTTLIILLFGSSLFAAVIALSLSRWLVFPKIRRTPRRFSIQTDTTRTYEFRNGTLINPVKSPDPFLNHSEDKDSAWTTLAEVLSRINPEVRTAFDGLRRTGTDFVVSGRAGRDGVTIAGVSEGEILRISVANGPDPSGLASDISDALQRRRLGNDRLRATADALPIVAWRETPEGRITWANAAYFHNLERLKSGVADHSWPPQQLFGSEIRPLPEPGQTRRSALELRNRSEPAWFDLSTRPLDNEVLIVAIPADRLVSVEVALREFVQTLSKTFADLPIGLAVFDRRRELVLFNPALVSLSTLDAQFLSNRPTLFSFLDQLREKRQMPEPKNYKVWRESIAKLENDAEEGTYQDLWTLPMGQTYRVIGRPHPGGAIAFMFEDISSEVSLTRQFRADLDLYQAAIDQNATAIAVFSVAGQLVMSNAAYADLWGHDPRELLGVLTLKEATQRWQTASMPAPLWGDIRDFAAQRQDRVMWTDVMAVPGRGDLFTRISPLKGGATMLSFELRPLEAIEAVEAKPASA